jgi:hypothetical protein
MLTAALKIAAAAGRGYEHPSGKWPTKCSSPEYFTANGKYGAYAAVGELLIKAGADVRADNSAALLSAATYGNYKLMGVLVTHGALTDSVGPAALRAAIAGGWVEHAALLLRAG